MKRPRITIGMVMIGVLILSADFALLRGVFANPFGWDTYKYAVSAPMTSLLLFALVIVAFDLWRQGEARPFVGGFCFVGAFIVVAFGWVWADVMLVIRYVRWVFGPLERLIPGWLASADDTVQITLVIVALTIPQIVLSAVGAMIASRIGLRLQIVSRLARPSDLPETIVDVVN